MVNPEDIVTQPCGAKRRTMPVEEAAQLIVSAMRRARGAWVLAAWVRYRTVGVPRATHKAAVASLVASGRLERVRAREHPTWIGGRLCRPGYRRFCRLTEGGPRRGRWAGWLRDDGTPWR